MLLLRGDRFVGDPLPQVGDPGAASRDRLNTIRNKREAHASEAERNRRQGEEERGQKKAKQEREARADARAKLAAVQEEAKNSYLRTRRGDDTDIVDKVKETDQARRQGAGAQVDRWLAERVSDRYRDTTRWRKDTVNEIDQEHKDGAGCRQEDVEHAPIYWWCPGVSPF
ncbi:hypothetical protein ACFV2N_46345 [Streptomyces sp. NPDC059680]|uniref:hypothetical protein n=1 Tax=Streptomyces sp. NPDC059680 TaxID=3346904 RepID=UPI003682A0DA